jgi:hypothetical protein
MEKLRNTRKIDMTGKTIGRWTVISESHKSKNGAVHWACVCTCGARRIIATATLKSGKTLSCGCKRDEERRLNLTGKRFGKWSVVSYSHKNKRGVHYWSCVCDCGVKRSVTVNALSFGSSKSCGCGQLESATKHGMWGSPTWQSWEAMKKRCLNPSNRGYKDYGGRGITICQEWVDSFEAFLRDMGERPEGKTLDRKNNSEGYSKANCQWSDLKTQQKNRRSCVYITFNGKTQTLYDWSVETGINETTIKYRLDHGWSAGQALTAKKHSINRWNRSS